jgi:hypothetical protein
MSDQENTDALPSEEIEDDVALRPGANADNIADVGNNNRGQTTVS